MALRVLIRIEHKYPSKYKLLLKEYSLSFAKIYN